MFKELFVNLTILSTLLFFGNIFFNRFRKSSLASNLESWLPWVNGIALGIVGIILMEFSFLVEGNSVVDLRQTAVIIAVYVAGIPGGLCASLLIAAFRLFFFGDLGLPSYIGAANPIVTFLLIILVLQKGRLEPIRWAVAFAMNYVVFLFSFFITIGTRVANIVPVYFVITVAAGVFTFFLLRYLKHSNDLFAFMEDAAHHDFLTGLYNSRSFHLAYDHRVKRASKNGEEFALILLDIDHFKRINDTYGHQAGDSVLRQFGTILSSFSPSDGYCARKGGEEFAIVINGINAAAAARIAERLRLGVEKHSFLLEDGIRLKVSVSIGYGSSKEGSAQTLFRRVDDALYQAKQTGRNRVCRALAQFDRPDQASSPGDRKVMPPS
ncbi:GGDEF domain-containing protein [Saccharibacillus kuerlensis]|uniref:GGDEF domain-containing protein n=1 Tax=Saccharibacillus kuerlensis TaxID=459527 RepID=A0ABQ2KTY5_9BACL|nr:diguanylate cyclase [Saccharibacillus kuerlensis]GGN93104.1 GGDEF domain-containing protein [Saccharibacillus kuerlensis]